MNYYMENIKSDPSFKGAYSGSLINLLYSNKIARKEDRFIICKEPLLTIPAVFHVKKNFYLVEEINESIKQMQAAGLIEYWISRYFDKGLVSADKKRKDPKVLSFNDLLGCFQILIIGYFASFIALLFELLIKYNKVIHH